MIDKVKFYAGIRECGLFNQLSVSQIETIDCLLNECEKQEVTDPRQMAYIFATAYHECFRPKIPATRMTPMKEYGGEEYLKSQKYYPYYGRGLSQLTNIGNYEKEGKRLGIDLLKHPDLILDIPLAASSHVYCMKHGTYTGKKLSDYINNVKCDFLNARRIVNGTDCQEKIMSYAQKFLSCLT